MASIEQTVTPENSDNMVEVREGVDAVDRALVKLLARRFAYMDAAAQIKQDRGAVRDEARKRQALDNVRSAAQATVLPEEAIVQLWDQLVEISIAYELEAWDRLRG